MTAVRYVKVVLEGQANSLLATYATTRKATADLGKELDTMAAKQSGKFNSMTTKAAVFGAGLTLAFGSIVKAGMEFDKQMSKVGAVADASAAQLGALRAAALQAGKDTAYTATQAAQGEEELAKAGISVADIINGGLTGALQLAAAGDIDLADAAKYASQAMIEFGLAGKDVAHIADVLTAGANKSVSDVRGLGDALGQAGTVAHQAGMSLDETVGVLALFAQHGLDGVEAGTTFKQMLLKLEGPSMKSADLMQSLGLNVYDAQGHFKSAAELADTLQQSLGGLTEQQRNAALATIFGSRAVRGAIDLYNAGAAGVDEWTNAVNDSGLAAKTAAEKQDNLAGDLKKLKGSISALAIESSGAATGGLRDLTQGATGLTNVVAGMPKPITETLTVLTGVGGVATLAAAGFLKARGTVKDFFDTLSNAGPTGAKAATALGRIGKVAGGVAIAGVAVGGLIEGLDALNKWTSAKEHPTAKQIDDLSKSLQTFGEYAAVSGELAKRFGSDLGGLAVDLKQIGAVQDKLSALGAGSSSANATNLRAFKLYSAQAQNSILDQKKAVEELDGALTKLVQNGGASQAAIALQNLEQQAGLTDTQISQLNALLPNYNKAAGDAAAANDSAAHGFGTAAANAQALQTGLSDLIAKGQTFLDVFKQINGAAISSKQADIGFQQSIDDLGAALDKQSGKFLRSKKAWDDNTQAGRDNNSAVLDAIQKAAEHAEAVKEQTGSVDDATAAWNNDIDALKRTLHQAGLTDAQIQSLIDTYAQMPPAVSTPVSAPGLAKVNDTASGYFRLLNEIDGFHANSTVTTHYKTDGHGSLFGGAVQRWGGAYEHAAVGALRDASVYSSVSSGARYAFAEPSTGGEAFVPKRGNYGRSMSILGQAASWYGAMVVPRGAMGGGGASVIEVHLIPAPGAASALVDQLRTEIRWRGGNVQTVLGRS